MERKKKKKDENKENGWKNETEEMVEEKREFSNLWILFCAVEFKSSCMFERCFELMVVVFCGTRDRD